MGALALHSLYCAVDNFSEDLTLLRNLDFPSFPSPHCPLMKVYYTHLCSVHCALSTVHWWSVHCALNLCSALCTVNWWRWPVHWICASHKQQCVCIIWVLLRDMSVYIRVYVYVCVCVCVWECLCMGVYQCASFECYCGMGGYRAHVASGPSHIYEVQATICTFWRNIMFQMGSNVLFYVLLWVSRKVGILWPPMKISLNLNCSKWWERVCGLSYNILSRTAAPRACYPTHHHHPHPYYVWGLNWGRGERTSYHLLHTHSPLLYFSSQDVLGRCIYYNTALVHGKNAAVPSMIEGYLNHSQIPKFKFKRRESQDSEVFGGEA